MSIQIPRTRLIFKVLIIGRDLALQTGFLTQVSGNSISTHLFSTLGVSLGIARYEENDEFALALQLWTIPLDERVAGLGRSFTKGYRAVIAVVRPSEVNEIPQLFQSLALDFDSKAIVVVVGRYDATSEAFVEARIHEFETLEPNQINDATEVIAQLSQRLMINEQSSRRAPALYVLDESACPPFEAPLTSSTGMVCTDQEIDEVQQILLDQGLCVTGDSCLIDMREGKVNVSLKTGSVRLQPAICNYCINLCKRNTNVCIIAADTGWSSQGLSQNALLVAAKIIALSERCIPAHIEAQLLRAGLCSKFDLKPDLEVSEIPLGIFKPFQKQRTKSKSLLEIAENRMKNGKLPKAAYNILKRRLQALEENNDGI